MADRRRTKQHMVALAALAVGGVFGYLVGCMTARNKKVCQTTINEKVCPCNEKVCPCIHKDPAHPPPTIINENQYIKIGCKVCWNSDKFFRFHGQLPNETTEGIVVDLSVDSVIVNKVVKLRFTEDSIDSPTEVVFEYDDGNHVLKWEQIDSFSFFDVSELASH